jgi:hypothetical protein
VLIANECDGRFVNPVALVSQDLSFGAPASAAERFEIGDVGVGRFRGRGHFSTNPLLNSLG